MSGDVKYVCVIIDDFSYRSSAYENVTIFDYGVETSTSFYDSYYYNYWYSYSPYDYGDIDWSETNWQNYGFYNVNEFYDETLVDSGYFGPELYDYNYFYNLYMYEGYTEYITTQSLYHYHANPNAAYEPGHGDWVLESFFQQLDDPSSVEVIAIDFDYTSGSDIAALFELSYGYAGLQWIVGNAMEDFYEAGNDYIMAGFSASWGSELINWDQLNTIESLLNEWGAVVLQSVANVNQASAPWGNIETNVINVGAYNTDQNGYTLFGDETGEFATDILADGYVVSRDGWGDNFGTSFATPKVFAEIVNYFDAYLTPGVLTGETELEPIVEMDRLTDAEVKSYTDELIQNISTEMMVTLNGSESIVNVLSDHVSMSPDPTGIPYSINDSGVILWDASYYQAPPLSVENLLTVIVDAGVLAPEAVLLRDLTEIITVESGAVTSHIVSYAGIDFNYSDVDNLITTVIRNNEFTSEFQYEIQEANNSYKDQINLVGVAASEDLLVSFAGSDGNYIA